MYTWGYIKQACLIKLDMTADEAIKIGLVNKFPFYANEAITQICSSIKAKSTFAHFNIWHKHAYFDYLSRKYNLSSDFDFSFLKTRRCNVEDLAIKPYDLQKIWHEFYDENIAFVQEIVSMPGDFVNFGDDINRVRFKSCDWQDATDDNWSTMGANKVMFYEPGEYLISYEARWYTFTPTTDDSKELDIPADIVDALPSYIVAQCYKIDDEAKANTYRVEFETFLARMEDNKARTNKTIHISGGW